MEIKIYQCTPIYHLFPFLCWAMKWLSKTNYSHYAIQCGNILIDASGQDVIPHSSFSFGNRYKISKTFTLEVDTDFEGFMNWAIIHITKKKGYLQFLGLVLSKCGIINNNPWRELSKNMLSNEMVLYLVQEFKGFQPKETGNYNLSKIENILTKYAI